MDRIEKNTVAIVLAGGRGTRMGGDVPKQYMDVCGKPLLYYTLKAFEDSFVNKIVLVCGKGDENYVQKEIVEKYDFSKVAGITCGGEERYHSVFQGLLYVEQKIKRDSDDSPIVFIHDGARPFVTEDILKRCYDDAVFYGSGVAAVVTKDTVKIADEKGFVKSTPKRDTVYLMQTPQTFDFSMIMDAYGQLINKEDDIKKAGISITDDAMVMEQFSDKPIKLSEGSYSNIKVTTKEDLVFMKNYLRN